MPPPQTEKLLVRLHDDGVAFVLVGATAGVVHGLARTTFDLDLVYWRHVDNIERLCQSLAPLNPRLRDVKMPIPFELVPEKVEALRDLPLETDWGDLDLLAEIAGLGDYESLLAHSETVNLFDRPIRLLTLDGLIAAKRAAARPQDEADVLALEALRELRRSSSSGAP